MRDLCDKKLFVAGWTLGGCLVDAGGRRVDGTKKNGNGMWTGWSRKVVKIERFTVY
jgi:hypothetical protein